jgi:hypothetical protein
MSAVRRRLDRAEQVPSASAISRAVRPPKYARASASRRRATRARIAVAFDHGSSSSTRELRNLVDQDQVRAGDAGLAPRRSTARLWAMVMSHVDRRPRAVETRGRRREDDVLRLLDASALPSSRGEREDRASVRA